MLIGRRKTDVHNCQRWEISSAGCNANLILSIRLEFALSSGPDATLEELPVREAIYRIKLVGH